MKNITKKISFIILITILLLPIKSIAAENITSKYYEIDSENNLITRIEPETTIEVFTKKVEGEIKVYKDKEFTNEVTEGFVGTGMFVKNGESVYTLSVVGDFDGDGKAQQVELTNIIKYIVGLKDSELEGIYFQSADLTGDKLVDQRDITKFIRYIVYGELDLGKKDVTEPEIEIDVLEKTSNKIKVKSIATDKETGIDSNVKYTYYIKKSSEPDSSYVRVQDTTDPICEFKNLKANETYTIKVEIPDREGNVGIGTIEITTENMLNITEQGVLTFSEVTWNNGKAQTTINTNTTYKIEYQVNNTSLNWTQATENGASITVENLNHNDIVYARLTDGINATATKTLTVKDEINPIVTISAQNTTSEITATATAQDNESGIDASATYAFYIKKANEADTSYELKQNTTSATYKFTELTANESYIVKVEVPDKAGNKTAETVNVTTGSMPNVDTQTGAITFSEVTWNNGKAQTTISTNTTYKIEYQVNNTSSNWTQATENGASITVENLNHNDIVYARLTDGINATATKTLTVKDEINPIVTISAQNTTSEITATATAQDNESGIDASATYAFYIKKANEADTSYELKQNTTSATYKFTELTANESYTVKVEVSDVAGNKGIKTVDITTENIPDATQTGAITFGNVIWTSGKASTTISTNTSYKIQYQINGTAGEWTTASSNGASITASGLSHGNVVYARLTDGTNEGNYTTLTIADTVVPNNATIILSTKNVQTDTSITARVTHSDSQSGVNISSSKWVFNKISGSIGINANSYTGGTFSSNGQTITLSASTEGTYYLHVLTIDNAGNAKETISPSILVENPKSLVDVVGVGDYIKYDPDTSSTSGILTELNTYSGTTENNSSTLKQENLNWIVLDIIEENGEKKVRLISEKETSSEIYLKGYKGYNNAVYLLDKICSTLYNKSGYVERVQNLKLDDIESHMIEKPTFESATYTQMNGKFYPNILTQEKGQTINGIQGNTLERSVQTAPITQTQDLEATSLTLTNTENWNSSNNGLWYEYDSSEYYQMFSASSLVWYWLSSRGVCTDSDYWASYGVWQIFDTKVYNEGLYYTDGTENEDASSASFRPVVTLNANVLIDTTNSGDGSTADQAYVLKLK